MNEAIFFVNKNLPIIFITILYIFFNLLNLLKTKNRNNFFFGLAFLFPSLIILHFFLKNAFLSQIIFFSSFIFYLDMFFIAELKKYNINNFDYILFPLIIVACCFFLLQKIEVIMVAVGLAALISLILYIVINKIYSDHEKLNWSTKNFSMIFIGCAAVFGFSNFIFIIVITFIVFMSYILYYGVINAQDELNQYNIIKAFIIAANLYLVLILTGFNYIIPMPNL